MADVEFDVGLNADGSEAAFVKKFAAIFEAAMKGVGRDIGKQLASEFRFAEKAVGGLNTALNATNAQARNVDSTFDAIGNSIRAVEAATKGISGSIGSAFDPRALAAVNDQLNEAIRLRNNLNDRKGSISTDEFRSTAAQIDLLIKSLTVTKAGFSQAAQAAREFNTASAKAAVEASRAATAEQQAIKSRYVVDTQRLAANELATIRANSAAQVADSRNTARQRVAAFELAGRTIIASERAVRAAFTGTSNIVSSAFNAIGRAGSSAATTIRQTFTTSNQQINQSYASTFRKNTSIVANEANQQTTIINKFAANAKTAINSVAATASTIAVGGLLGAGVATALTSGFTRAANLEDAQRAFTVFLGDAEKSAKLTASILETVTGTPFKLDQFTLAASQLLAFNIAAEEVPNVLKVIADAAAAQGGRAGETVDRLVRVFGQITSAGKATTEDLNQLTEAGIPAFKILGNALGVTTNELRELVTEGAVPADVAIQSLLNGISQGSDGVNGATVAFDGLAKSLGTTMRGSLANFGTAFARAGANVITTFGPALTGALAAATAAVDLIGVAFARLAVAISNAPLFKLVLAQVQALGPALVSLKKTLTPVFDLIANGVVIVGQFGAALTVFRNAPTIFRLVATAIGSVLTPMNLFIGAAVLLAGYFQKLYKESGSFAATVKVLGLALQGLVAPLSTLANSILGPLLDAVGGTLSTAFTAAESAAENLATKGLRILAVFIRTQLTPALEELADLMTNEIVPRVGVLLRDAVSVGRTALGALGTGLENLARIVGPVIEPLVGAFQTLGDAIRTAAQDNDFSQLQAGFAGIGDAALALAEDLGSRIASGFSTAFEAAKDAFGNLIDGGVLKKVGVGILKVANLIGETLGNIATDRRLLTAAAAIAAAGIAIGAAFVVGVVEGVASNIPELVDGLGNALKQALSAAFKAATSDPKIIAGLGIALFGGAALAALRSSAIKAGQVVSAGLTQGIQKGGVASPGSAGFGGGSRDFVSALFGGRAAVDKAIKTETEYITKQTVAEFQRQQRVIQRVTGTPLRGANSQIISNRDVRAVTDETNRLATQLGTARLAAFQLREGLSTLGKGFLGGGITQIQSGIRGIGDALRSSGPEIAASAGAAIGGAFGVAFALSAEDPILKVGGLIASVGGAFAVGGAPAAGLALGLGLVATAFQQNAKEAQEAKVRASEYAEVLREFPSLAAGVDVVGEVFKGNLAEESNKVKDAFIQIGISYDTFVNRVAGGKITLDDLDDSFVNVTNAANGATKQGISAFTQELLDAGLTANEAVTLLGFLRDEYTAIQTAAADAARSQRLDNAGMSSGAILASELATQMDARGNATQIAADATAAYQQTLEDLNNERLDGLRETITDAQQAADAAGDAAETARDKFREFLSGGDTSAAEAANNAIIEVARVSDSVTQAYADIGSGAATNVSVAGAEISNSLIGVQETIAGLLQNVTSPADAQAALQPLIDAAGPVGTAGGDAIRAEVAKALESFGSEEGQGLLAGIFNAETLQAEADAAVAGLSIQLEAALTVDPASIPDIAAEAKAAFETAGAESAEGYGIGLNDGTGSQAATQFANDALAAAEDALGISSPSTAFADLGAFSVAGYVQGVQSATPTAVAAIANMAKATLIPLAFLKSQFILVGIQAGQGLAAGISASTGTVTAAAARLGTAAINTFEAVFDIASPSKAMRGIGVNVGEGLAVGVVATEGAVRGAAEQIGGALMEGVTIGIAQGGKIVYNGIEIFEEGVVTRSVTVGEAIGEAIGFGLAESGPAVLGSIDSIIDDILFNAQSQVGKLQQVGTALASALFGRMGEGGVFGTGGSSAVNLQQQFLELANIPNTFAQQFEKFGAFSTQFNTDNFIGRENQQLFLQAGTQIREYAQALIEAGRPLGEVIYETSAWRDQLIAAARTFGITDAELNHLLTTLGLTDPQLGAFAANVAAINEEIARGNVSAERRLELERERIRLEREAEKALAAQEAALKRASEEEERAKKAAEEAANRREREFRSAPVFRDLIINPVTGDPEAIALATANKVAFQVSRS